MSRRNTKQGKARRRAERERRRSVPSGQEPGAVEVQAVQVAPRPDGSGRRNSDENGSGFPNPDERGSDLRSDADGGLIAAEPGEADLDTGAEPADFDDLDPDDADLQATLTVLAVLADDISEDISEDISDDISDVTEVADDLVGDEIGRAHV